MRRTKKHPPMTPLFYLVMFIFSMNLYFAIDGFPEDKIAFDVSVGTSTSVIASFIVATISSAIRINQYTYDLFSKQGIKYYDVRYHISQVNTYYMLLFNLGMVIIMNIILAITAGLGYTNTVKVKLSTMTTIIFSSAVTNFTFLL